MCTGNALSYSNGDEENKQGVRRRRILQHKSPNARSATTRSLQQVHKSNRDGNLVEADIIDEGLVPADRELKTGCSKTPKAWIPLPGKKGIGLLLQELGLPKNYVENMPKVVSLNVYWNYAWSANRPPNQPDNIEFVPMVWGYYGDTTSK